MSSAAGSQSGQQPTPPPVSPSSGTKLGKVGRRYSTCVPFISFTTTVSLDPPSTESGEPPPLRRTSSHKLDSPQTMNKRNVRVNGQDDQISAQEIPQSTGCGRNSHAARQRRMSRNHLTINWSENQGQTSPSFTRQAGQGSSSFDCGGLGSSTGLSVAASSTLGSSMLLLPQGAVSRRKSFINQVKFP